MKKWFVAAVAALAMVVPGAALAESFSFHADGHDAFNGELISYDGTLHTSEGYDDGLGGLSYDVNAATGTFTVGTSGFGGTIEDGFGAFTLTGANPTFVDLSFLLQTPYSMNFGGIGVATNFLNGIFFSEGGGRIEHLSITPLATAGVPEPAAWTLMILGFGAAGAALRRRRQAGAPAIA